MTNLIPAIPTKFAGINFRSRLEAKWAAMFSLMGLDWEYEPFDAKGYIPDFVLLGDDPLLVEVKPAMNLDECWSHVSKVEAALEGNWTHDILIVGATPTMPGPEGGYAMDGWEGWNLIVGLLGERWDEDVACDDFPGHWEWGIGLWNQCGKCGLFSFRHEEQSYRSRVCGHYDGDHYLGPVTGVRDAWAHATNVCQWKP